MPLTLPSALKTTLGLETTTLCTLWSIERRDGTTYYFTDHDQEIVFEGNTYKVGVGYNRQAVEDKGDMSVDEMNVQGILNLTDVTREDIRGQRFDGATVTLSLVDYKRLSLGSVIRRKGWFGELKQAANGEFDVELRGLSQALTEAITKPFTPACTVDLGSSQCKVPLGSDNERVDGAFVGEGQYFTVPDVDDMVFQATRAGLFSDETSFDSTPYLYANDGDTFVGEGTLEVRAYRAFKWPFTVVSVTNLRSFEVSGVEDAVASDPTYFDGGLLSFITGNNNAINREMSSYEPTTVTGEGSVSLYLKAPFTIEVGDTGFMYPACDKSIATCKSRFRNVINFRGFPHIPGDKYLKDYPDAK